MKIEGVICDNNNINEVAELGGSRVHVFLEK